MTTHGSGGAEAAWALSEIHTSPRATKWLPLYSPIFFESNGDSISRNEADLAEGTLGIAGGDGRAC